MDDVSAELRLSFRRLGPWAAAAGVLVALFLLTPLLAIVPIAFSADRYLTFPPTGFSLRWLTEVFTDADWQAAFGQSVYTATVATVLAVLAGTGAALALPRTRRATRLLRTVLLAPMVVPPLVLALGLYLAVDDLGGSAGIRTLILGQATLAAPLVYVSVAAGLGKVDPALSRAARGLGHGWVSVLRRVELPLVARSIAGSAILAFGLCFDESVLSYYLAPPGEETLPTLLWLDAGQQASPAIAAVSTLVMGMAVALLGLAVLLARPRPAPVFVTRILKRRTS
ncbi:ABC transporter permease [Streptomyces sp. NBC_00445]|uniref:ABC transporter permease n=1 Tax=Streptomyces sp. NBC_00445 TaxID=2975745 RepID=UPI002E1C7CAF